MAWIVNGTPFWSSALNSASGSSDARSLSVPMLAPGTKGKLMPPTTISESAVSISLSSPSTLNCSRASDLRIVRSLNWPSLLRSFARTHSPSCGM